MVGWIERSPARQRFNFHAAAPSFWWVGGFLGVSRRGEVRWIGLGRCDSRMNGWCNADWGRRCGVIFANARVMLVQVSSVWGCNTDEGNQVAPGTSDRKVYGNGFDMCRHDMALPRRKWSSHKANTRRPEKPRYRSSPIIGHLGSPRRPRIALRLPVPPGHRTPSPSLNYGSGTTANPTVYQGF